MRLWVTNRIDAAGVTITESSEATGLPSSNVANALKTKVWRTGTSTADEWAVFDLGADATATSCIIFAHTLTASDSAIAVQAHTSNSWGSPAFSQSISYASGAMFTTFSSQNYRFWRVKFTKASSGVSRDIGRIFIGPYSQIDDVIDWDGLTLTKVDRSLTQTSVGGQSYTDRRDGFTRITATLSNISTTHTNTLQGHFDEVGQHTPFFFQTEASGLSTIYYVKFGRDLKADVSGMDSDLLYNVPLELEEQL